MPYTTKKLKGGKTAIVKADTGKIVGKSDSAKKAAASIRARMASEHGWRPTKRKPRG